MLSRYAILGGRRRAGRRQGENEGSFVDQHGAWLFLAASAVVLLNVLDAFFTILFLSHGGRELNPLVDAVLQMGLGWFLALKSVGIGICVAVLTLAKNFRAARIGLHIVLSGYTLLLGWHLYLLQHLP